MKLEDIRRRGIDLKLKDHRDLLSRDLLPALICAIGAGILFLSTLAPPEAWARGDWFKPGGFLYERFGMAGAVLAVRATLALFALAGLGYFAWTVYRLTGGLAARRARLAAEYKVFDPPDRRD